MIGAAIAEAVVRVRADTAGFRQEVAAGVKTQLAGIDGGLAGASKSALKFSGAMFGISAAATVGAVALREIVVGAAQTEQQLDVLNVVLNATDEEMKQISETASALGADVTLPGISAGDAAVAMNELAKAGLNVRDTMQGARGVLQLSAAAGIGVADAAKLVGSALNTFGLAGDQATHVTDLLAGASIAAQGEVSDMGLALQQAGAVARQAGLSIEQTVGAIGLLAENGIQGSDAGTSIRTMLLKLIPTTKEAKAFTEALGIQFDETATLGDQLPSLFAQYKNALEQLDPALQQVALTQIFGTDAIRAASIFAREGADGYAEMVREVDRLGAGNELAGARTEGLIGKFEGLKSSLSTLAEELGEVVNPAIGGFVDTITENVGNVIAFTKAVKDLSGSVSDFVENIGNIPGTDFGLGDVFSFGNKVRKFTNPITAIPQAVKFARDQIEEDAPKINEAIRDSITASRVEEQARERGLRIGHELGDATAQGIAETAGAAVEAARQTVTRVAEQGREAVRAAIASGQQNLASIGSSLAQDAGAIIDATVKEGVSAGTSAAAEAVAARTRQRQQKAIRETEAELAVALKNVPIMREIERIKAEIDRGDRDTQATDVRRGLRDAQEELAAAQRQAGTAGQLDPGQMAARAKFLRPFKEGVQDARGEVKKFNLEARLDKLQKGIAEQTDDITENIDNLRDSLREARQALIDSQKKFDTGGVTNSLKSAAAETKKTVERGIDDAIDAFNRGQITLPQLNKRIAKLLEANKVDYKNAGGVLGTAFVNEFRDKLKAVGAQAQALLPEARTGQGSVPPIVVPASVRRTATLNNQEAQRALQEALVAAEEAGYNELVRIRRALEGKDPPVRPKRRGSAADKANAPRTTTRPKPRTKLHDPPEN